jgi:N-acyl amino acid synthase FeeM
MQLCKHLTDDHAVATGPPSSRRATVEERADGSFVVLGLSRTITAKRASRRGEFERAFALLAAKYQARGYDEPSGKPFRFTPHHALPNTLTFVAKDGERVVATLSMVPDSPLLRLPMESIYGEEIARLR